MIHKVKVKVLRDATGMYGISVKSADLATALDRAATIAQVRRVDQCSITRRKQKWKVTLMLA